MIVGDAARMVHKVAGPFDVIFNAGDEERYAPLLDRLAALLRPGGVLITGNVLRPTEAVAGPAGPPGAGGRDGRGLRPQPAARDGSSFRDQLPPGGGRPRAVGQAPMTRRPTNIRPAGKDPCMSVGTGRPGPGDRPVSGEAR